MKDANFSELVGKTLTAIDVEPMGFSEEMTFRTSDGSTYKLKHFGECCESVTIEDITGDISDLIGNPILTAEEVSNSDEPRPNGADSWTWTFYKLSTIKGSVTIRWLGESNGYYSESVDFLKL